MKLWGSASTLGVGCAPPRNGSSNRRERAARENLQNVAHTGEADLGCFGIGLRPSGQGPEGSAGEQPAEMTTLHSIASPARASVAAVPRTAGVALAAIADAAELGSRYYNPANGTFELRDLLPGSYIVTASIQTGQGGIVAFPPTGKSTTSTTVTITDADVDGIGITVAPAATVSGRLRYDGQAPRITGDFIPFQLVALNSSPADVRTQLFGMRFVATPPGNADGTFRVDNVAPGEYRVAMLSPGGGNFVR